VRVAAVCLALAAATFAQQKPRLVVQRGHTGSLVSAAISPDGRLLATVGRVNAWKRWPSEVLVWHAATGNLLARLKGNGPVAFTPDSRRLVTQPSPGKLRMWDVATAKEIWTVDLGREVDVVALSPGGRLLLAGTGSSLSYRLLEAANGKEVRRLQNGESSGDRRSNQNHGFTFSPDGKLLASVRGRAIQLWDVASGRRLRQLPGLVRDQRLLLFTSDGRRLLAPERHTIALWDLATGKIVKRFEGHRKESRLAAMAVSRDGKALTSMWARVEGAVRYETLLWELSSGKVLRRFAADAVSVAFTPDGPRAVTRHRRGKALPRTARLWDAETGREVARFVGGKPEAPRLRFARAGVAGQVTRMDWLVAGGSVWDLIRGRRFRYDRRNIATLRLLPGVQDLEEIVRRQKLAEQEVVAWSPDASRHAVTRGPGKTLRLLDVDASKVIAEFAGTDALFSPRGRLLVAGPGADHLHRIYDATTGNEQHVIGRFPIVRFSPDDRFGAIPKDNFDVKIVDLATGEERARLNGHMGRVVAVAFSADGTAVLTGSMDGTARLWNPATGKELLRVVGGGPVAFHPDRSIFATSAPDGLVRLWEFSSGRLLCTCVGFGKQGWAVVDPDGRYDASSGGDVDGLHWVVNNEPLALDQLKERYYDPGLLAKHLGYHKEPLRVVKAFAAPKLYPAIRLEPPTGAAAVLRIHLTNRGGGIGRVVVKVNGKELTADARGAAPDPEAKALSLSVPLAGDPRLRPGEENTIEVEAYNAEGYLRSRGMRVKFTPKGEADKPVHLWAVIAGVSDYRGDAIDLRYAAKDAADFAVALKTAAAGLFGAERVHVTHLDQPDRADLVAALEAARAAGPNDVLVLYLAGHGVSLDDFYFLTRAARSADLSDPEVRRRVALASSELTELVKAIPATKQVLILDTCASGKFIDQLTEKRDVPSGQIRALERLKDRTGLHILAGCAADRVSFEATRYAQGLLTYSLLLGMRGAALRDDEYVDVSKLFQFAADRVPELARGIGGIQRPVVASPRGGASFDIGQLGEAAKAKVPLRTVRPLVLRTNFQDDEQLIDVLGLAKKVNRLLKETPGLVFVDASEFPEAFRVVGRYRIDGDKVSVKVGLARGGKTVRFEVAGSKAEIAGRLVAEVVRRMK